jgi:hypothetical protein
MNIGTYEIEDYQVITPEGEIINKRKIIYYDSAGKEELIEFFDNDPDSIRNGYISR